MKTDKIVIVGGGSAGWMTAATMIKTFPNKDITVIESPDVPTVGVGESTLGQIVRWVRYIGIDEADFFPFTDATYKMSIKFTDFYKQGTAFHYPFGVPERDDENKMPLHDWHVIREYVPELKGSDMVDYLFPTAQLWENNKFYENRDGRLGSYIPERVLAYHFDAARFGLWLKERYCMPRGVKYLPKHIDKIETDENGVKELILSDGERVTADLFVDCTGFRSLLLAGALEEPFVSYGDILKNNTAWATQIPYHDKYKELELYTNCTAIDNGWVWNIPLWSRIGTGYVFSDLYVTPEDALEEFKNYLCSDKMVVPRTREEVDGYEFRKISMRVGIHERIFVKNVVAIGLSAGFIEPLESNGLYSVHEFLFHLMDIMARGEVTQLDKQWFNLEVRDMFDGFAKFVTMHYAMSNRTDTKYWRDIMNREYPEDRFGTPNTPYIHRSGGFNQAQRRFFDMWKNHPEIDGINYISIGCEYRQMGGPRIIELEYSREKGEVREKALELFSKWVERKHDWENTIKEAPHIVDYMKKRFYFK